MNEAADIAATNCNVGVSKGWLQRNVYDKKKSGSYCSRNYSQPMYELSNTYKTIFVESMTIETCLAAAEILT
jgi:hypothetical protein